jgi:hypothetical protein
LTIVGKTREICQEIRIFDERGVLPDGHGLDEALKDVEVINKAYER